MTQESLFTDPELRAIHTLSSSEVETLEVIAQRAAAFPLLYGEHANASLTGRLETIHNRLKDGPTSHNYLVYGSGKIVGYLSIWDGYDPHTMEVEQGKIELGFLDPLERKYEGLLKVKAEAKLCDLEREAKNDW